MIVTGGNAIVIEKDGVSQKIYSAGDDFEAYQVDSRSVVTLLMTNDDEWHLFGDLYIKIDRDYFLGLL